MYVVTPGSPAVTFPLSMIIINFCIAGGGSYDPLTEMSQRLPSHTILFAIPILGLDDEDPDAELCL